MVFELESDTEEVKENQADLDDSETEDEELKDFKNPSQKPEPDEDEEDDKENDITGEKKRRLYYMSYLDGLSAD